MARTPDLQGLLRLRDELHVLPGNLELRGQHLLAELSRLVEAQVGILLKVQKQDARKWQPLLLADVGWISTRQRSLVLDDLLGPHDDDPMQELFGQVHRDHPVITRTRRQIIDDDPWYASSYVRDVLRPAHLDDCLMSVCRMTNPFKVGCIILHRAAESPRPFSNWHRQLVHLFHSDLQWLYAADELHSQNGSTKPLSPRLRQTLEFLLAGQGEKQIAVRLGVSRHTVHVYVKALHKRFGVSSRAELLARYLRGR